jgi:hypothetical protein
METHLEIWIPRQNRAIPYSRPICKIWLKKDEVVKVSKDLEQVTCKKCKKIYNKFFYDKDM